MTHHTSNYETLLREHGFRVTPQRQLILDAICAGGGHTMPEEIYQRVHAKAPAVNLATVYRTVAFLRDLHLVTELRVGDKTYYEIVGEAPHHHLICRRCGKTEQIRHEAVKALFTQIEHEQKFLVETDHLALIGLCKVCRATETSSGSAAELSTLHRT